MSLCPSIWCPRCKVSHPGECPPKKQSATLIKPSGTSIVGAIEELSKAMAASYVGAYPATPAPNPIGPVVAVGTTWKIEMHEQISGAWMETFGSSKKTYYYTVVKVLGSMVDVRSTLRPGDPPSTFTLDAWEDAGEAFPNDPVYDRVRFVP